MAISVVQRGAGQDNNGGTGHIALAFGSSNTASNAIIVCGAIANTNTDSLALPTDSQGNVYTQIGPPAGFVGTGASANQFNGQRWWISYGIKAGANTVTLQDGNFATNLHIWEVTGLAASNSFDKSAFAFQVGTTALSSGATPTTSFANELVLVVACDDVTGTAYTVGSGYSNLQTQTNAGFSSASEEKVVAATGAQTGTMTIVSAATDSLIVTMTFADTATTQPAISAVLLGSTYNTTTGTHTVTATPTAGSLIVIITGSTGNTATTTPTDNNSTGTYTSIVTALKATSVDIMTVNVRNATIASAVSTVFTHAPGTSTGGGLSVYQITGASGTGASAVRQSTSQANHAGASAPAPVFGSAALTADMIISAVFNVTNSPALTPKSGYTMDVDRGYATPTTGMDIMSIPSGETGTTITWGSSSATAYASIALELIAAGSSTNGTVTQVGATVTATGGTQAIATINDAAITQSGATVIATGGTQAATGIVVTTASVTQVGATVTAAGGTAAISIQTVGVVAQTHATVTATGGTQAIATINFSSIAQVHATVTATGGTQLDVAKQVVAIAQTVAVVTATAGTQTFVTKQVVAIAQTHATVTATGGTQADVAVRIIAISQTHATVTATGGTQTAVVFAHATIAQVGASVIARGGVPSIVAKIPPQFVPLTATISSFTNADTQNSETNVADVAGGGTISDVSTSSSDDDVSSTTNQSNVSSNTNEADLN